MGIATHTMNNSLSFFLIILMHFRTMHICIIKRFNFKESDVALLAFFGEKL